MLGKELINVYDGNTYVFNLFKDKKNKESVSYKRYSNGVLYSEGSMSDKEFDRLLKFKVFIEKNDQ